MANKTRHPIVTKLLSGVVHEINKIAKSQIYKNLADSNMPCDLQRL